MYYIRKFGLNGHSSRLGVSDSGKYLNSLFGRILFVLLVDSSNKEFKNYKDFVKKDIVPTTFIVILLNLSKKTGYFPSLILFSF